MGRKDKPVSLQGDNAHSVGARLRAARNSKKIKLTTLARDLNYSVGYLSGVETGKHEVPEGLILRYEEALDLRPGELSEFVQAHQRTEFAARKAAPAGKQPHWYVPLRRNPFFTGRETILEDMYKRLWSSRVTSHVLSIVGISGIGKTHLALEYAYRYGKQYQGVFWLDASSSETLVASCLELARYLEVAEKDAPDRRMTIIGVQRQLKRISRALVMLDNVEDPASLYTIEFPTSLEDFLSQLGECDIIVTTRMRIQGPITQTIDLAAMEIDESAALLLRRASSNALLPEVSETSLDLARTIAEKMGGLPIALEQAGAYLEETGCGLAGYLHLLEETLQKEVPDHLSFLPYPLHVAEMWLLSVEKVRALNPDAVELLYFCAFLGSGKVYEEFLIEAACLTDSAPRALPTNPFPTNTFKLHQTVGILRKYALVRTDAESGALSMHPLVQAAIQNSLDLATRQQWATRVVKIVSQLLPTIREEINYRDKWEQFQLYFPQAEACITLIKYWKMPGEEATRLLRKVGKYLEERAQLKDAEEMYRRALNLDKRYYGERERHIAVATDLGHLGILYEKQNYDKLAEEFYEQAASIMEQLGEPEGLDPEVEKRYYKLLRKTKQDSKAGKFRRQTGALQREQGERALQLIKINDDDEYIIYQKEADWLYEQHRGIGDFKDDAHATSIKGAAFEYHFEGIGIEIISNTLSTQGEIAVYIDDRFVDTVNLSLISRLTQTIIFSKTNLPFGPHTLKVILITGTFVLDALTVFSYEELERNFV